MFLVGFLNSFEFALSLNNALEIADFLSLGWFRLGTAVLFLFSVKATWAWAATGAGSRHVYNYYI